MSILFWRYYNIYSLHLVSVWLGSFSGWTDVPENLVNNVQADASSATRTHSGIRSCLCANFQSSGFCSTGRCLGNDIWHDNCRAEHQPSYHVDCLKCAQPDYDIIWATAAKNKYPAGNYTNYIKGISYYNKRLLCSSCGFIVINVINAIILIGIEVISGKYVGCWTRGPSKSD